MSKTQYYTILSGDSLWRISQKFGTSVDELVRLNNFSSQNVMIHPGQQILVPLVNGDNSVPSTPTINTSGNEVIEKVIKWFKDRKGKVGYSMELRQGPNYYDCSSAVYSALIYSGFLKQGTYIGNTDSLFAMDGKQLVEIPFSEVRRGDIFISGFKGNSANDLGHTGVFLDSQNIIHCTYSYNGQQGIVESSHVYGQISNRPTYYYRLKGVNNSLPSSPVVHPNPTINGEHLEKSYAENGRFTANKNLSIRNEYQENAEVINTLFVGESVNYDKVYVTNKFVYISYVSYSGTRRYIAIRTNNSGSFGSVWGSIV